MWLWCAYCVMKGGTHFRDECVRSRQLSRGFFRHGECEFITYVLSMSSPWLRTRIRLWDVKSHFIFLFMHLLWGGLVKPEIGTHMSRRRFNGFRPSSDYQWWIFINHSKIDKQFQHSDCNDPILAILFLSQPGSFYATKIGLTIHPDHHIILIVVQSCFIRLDISLIVLCVPNGAHPYMTFKMLVK